MESFMIQNCIQNKHFSRLFHVILLLIWLFIWREHPAYMSYNGEYFTKRTLLIATGIILLIAQIIMDKPLGFKVFYFGILVLILVSFYQIIYFAIENDGFKLFESKYLTNKFIDLFKPLVLLFLILLCLQYSYKKESIN